MGSDEAPGWDAIERAVAEHVQPEDAPLHWSTGVLPGQDGVYGISGYRVPQGVAAGDVRTVRAVREGE